MRSGSPSPRIADPALWGRIAREPLGPDRKGPPLQGRPFASIRLQTEIRELIDGVGVDGDEVVGDDVVLVRVRMHDAKALDLVAVFDHGAFGEHLADGAVIKDGDKIEGLGVVHPDADKHNIITDNLIPINADTVDKLADLGL